MTFVFLVLAVCILSAQAALPRTPSAAAATSLGPDRAFAESALKALRIRKSLHHQLPSPAELLNNGPPTEAPTEESPTAVQVILTADEHLPPLKELLSNPASATDAPRPTEASTENPAAPVSFDSAQFNSSSFSQLVILHGQKTAVLVAMTIKAHAKANPGGSYTTMPTYISDSYTFLDEDNTLGQNKVVSMATTHDECSKQCVDKPDCNLYMWHSSMICTITQYTQTLDMARAGYAPNYLVVVISNRVYERTRNGLCWDTDGSYGADMGVVYGLSKDTECAAKCMLRQDCNVAIYETWSGVCYLKVFRELTHSCVDSPWYVTFHFPNRTPVFIKGGSCSGGTEISKTTGTVTSAPDCASLCTRDSRWNFFVHDTKGNACSLQTRNTIPIREECTSSATAMAAILPGRYFYESYFMRVVKPDAPNSGRCWPMASAWIGRALASWPRMWDYNRNFCARECYNRKECNAVQWHDQSGSCAIYQFQSNIDIACDGDQAYETNIMWTRFNRHW